MKPIRILYVIDDLWSSMGGSEQHLLWLLRTIPDAEFEKHFIVFSNFRTDDAAFSALNPVILGREIGSGARTWLKRLRYLAKYIREHEIDLVQAFGPMGELVAILAVRLARHGRVIGNRRDCGYDRSAKLRWIFWLSRQLGTRYIANSEAARQAAYRNDQTPLDRIVVIRNPVSIERFREILAVDFSRDDLSVPEESRSGKWIGMVATVRPIKDHATLIRAAKIVLQNIPDAWLLFVGEQQPKQREILERLAEEEGVAARIIWYGGVGNPLQIVSLFDVAVLSSHSESFSNAVLEYAAAERPIVVSDVGGLGEIIRDGESGFLVPPESPDVLAERIVRLLSNPDRAASFGKAAKEFVFQRYDEKEILKKYVEYYRSFFNGPIDESSSKNIP